MSVIIELDNISKKYSSGGSCFQALRPVTLKIERGDFVGIVGKSGSGKSSLLNLMAGIDAPSSGRVVVNGLNISQLRSSELDAWRGKNIGLVFQFFQLIPTLNALENIMLPMEFCQVIPKMHRRRRALELLDKVQLGDKSMDFPSTLSGGEKQRVAIARALANNAPIICADEPTGNLDSKTAEVIYGLLQDLNAQGTTIVLISHDPEIHQYTQYTIPIEDGDVGTAQHGSAEVSGEISHV